MQTKKLKKKLILLIFDFIPKIFIFFPFPVLLIYVLHKTQEESKKPFAS
jgi:TRAP-type mannitol/chloroaromatic compound transport system permease small subunit